MNTGGLSPGSIVVADDASVVPTRKLACLLHQADAHKAKVLVGSPAQLPLPLGRGPMGAAAVCGLRWRRASWHELRTS